MVPIAGGDAIRSYRLRIPLLPIPVGPPTASSWPSFPNAMKARLRLFAESPRWRSAAFDRTRAQSVEDFAWSPDSNRLVLVLRDASDEELEAAANKEKEGGEDKANSSNKKSKDKNPDHRPLVVQGRYGRPSGIVAEPISTSFDLATKSLKQVSSGDYDDFEPAGCPMASSWRSPATAPSRTRTPPITLIFGSSLPIIQRKGREPDTDHYQSGRGRPPRLVSYGQWITYSTSRDPKL